ncbi:MAG: hypothetical protein ACUVV0_09880 [Anaerolineae bacterium]
MNKIASETENVTDAVRIIVTEDGSLIVPKELFERLKMRPPENSFFRYQDGGLVFPELLKCYLERARALCAERAMAQ